MARKNTSKPAQPMKKSRGLTKTADDFENVSSLDTQYGIKKRLHRDDDRLFSMDSGMI